MSANWLGLPPADRPRFGRIALAFAFTQVTSLAGYLGAMGCFLKSCGAPRLPWTFLIGYILSFGLTSLLTRLRLRPVLVTTGFFAAYAGFMGLAFLAAEQPWPWAHAVITTGVIPFAVLCWMLFWNALEGHLVLREVKTWTPLVSAAGLLAQVVVGLGAGALGRAFGVRALFALAALSMLASIVVLLRTVGTSGGRQEAASAGVDLPSNAAGPEEPSTTDSSAGLVWTMARLVFVGAWMKYLVDYQLNQAAALNYPDAAAMAAFLGRFDSCTKFTIFVMQTSVTGRLFAIQPPGRVLAAMPLMVSLAAAALVAGGGLPALLSAHFLFTLFDKGINRSAYNLCLAPFLPEVARRARVRLDGQTLGLGVVSVSIAMLTVPALLTPPVAFTVLGLLCLVQLHGTLGLDGHYLRALEANLQGGDQGAGDEMLGRLRAFGSSGATDVLVSLLAHAEPERRRLAARELGRTRAPSISRALDTALASESHPRVQAELVHAVARAGGDVAGIRKLLGSKDPRVRANAIEALTELPRPATHMLPQAGNAPARPGPLCAAGVVSPEELGLDALLAGQEPRPRAAAVALLVRHGLDRQSMTRALTEAWAMLEAPDAGARAAACWALGTIGHRALVPALVDRLDDVDLAVRRQAVFALERMWAPAALPTLRLARQRPENEPMAARLDRLVARLEDRTQREVLAALGSLGAAERATLAGHLTDLAPGAWGLVARALRIESPGYRTRVGRALREARTGGTRDLLDRCIPAAGSDSARVTLAPLVDAATRADGDDELWTVLGHLSSRSGRPELYAGCRVVLRSLAAAIAGGDPDATVYRARLERLLELAVGSAARGIRALQAPTDRRQIGLAVELFEKMIDDVTLRVPLCALVEASTSEASLRVAAERLVSPS